MYCKNCGKELKEGNKFCAKCGTPISQKITNAATVIKEDIVETKDEEISSNPSVEKAIEETRAELNKGDRANRNNRTKKKISKKALVYTFIGLFVVVVIVMCVLNKGNNKTTKEERKELDRCRDRYITALENEDNTDVLTKYVLMIKDIYKQGKLGYIYYDYNGDQHDDLIIGNIEPEKNKDSDEEFTKVYLVVRIFKEQGGEKYNSFTKYYAHREVSINKDYRVEYFLLQDNKVCEVRSEIQNREETMFHVFDKLDSHDHYDLFENEEPIKLKLKPIKK